MYNNNLYSSILPNQSYSTVSGGMSAGGQAVPAGTPIVSTNYSTPGTYNKVSNTYNPQPAILGSSVERTGSTSGGSSVQSAPTVAPTNTGSTLQSELDAIFNPVFSALQGQEETLNQNYAPVEGQIQAQADLSKQSLADQQASGMRELATQETAAGTRKEDALTSATRLYNELQRGGQQRFGGASSAGEAYQTLTATEQQRRQGTIQSAYETAVQQIGQYKANLQEKYQTAVKEVELQTQQAIADAQAQFRDALQSIRSARATAESDKASASMNILQDLRNKVFSINQQALQFTQQLALNHEASLKTVDAYTQNALQQVQGGQTTLNSNLLSNYSPTTSFGMSGGQQQVSSPYQAGQIASTRKYDQFGNPIA